MSDSQRIPLMFQAQLPDRGKIQYAGNPEPASRWVKQWLEGCPTIAETPETSQENIPVWKRKAIAKPNIKVKLPQFGARVHSWEYTFTWRMVTNSGQDEGVIRPVIGAKGLPYYPGASMKGAFRRACPNEELRTKYCGDEEKPGCLRFHGGYPVDMSWGDKKRLIDVVHPQANRQLGMDDKTTSANVQISLYQTTFKFGISSNEKLSESQWKQIQQIWEAALSKGIGSRVSAGYGYVKKLENGKEIQIQDSNNVIFSVNLRGQGLASLLLTKKGDEKNPEFRINMFKAALRGHTLRLFAGLTDEITADSEITAQRLTKEIWGGFEGKKAIVGKLGINFHAEKLTLGEYRFNKDIMPTYALEAGRLDIVCCGIVSEEERQQLAKLAKTLMQFSLLLGGFGKSWRRVDHRKFYNQYVANNNKPMIGCHWEFAQSSEILYVTAASRDLQNISKFLNNIDKTVIKWFEFNRVKPSNFVNNWREVWHSSKVQVWGKIVQESEAVYWFHGNYSKNKSIKETDLTGKIGKIGRIWHRMYPRYVVDKSGKLKHTREYIELLTIFPDNSTTTKEFLNFLADSSGFLKLF
jgi:CRISPR-associated protein Cmr6